jgi:hypothetical protein
MIKTRQSSRLAPAIIVVLFTLIFSLISLATAVQKSPTFDEPIHLYAGYSHLRWGDFRVNPEHPPLAKILAALPLLALDINSSAITKDQRDIVQARKQYDWNLADQFILANRRIDKLFLYPKLVMIGLAAILGVFIFLWTREIYGLNAAFAALAIYCFDPNFLAHSSIIHTDVPFTLFFFAGTYFFWRTLNRVTWINLFFTSLFFAVSAITKFSFLMIFPVWALLGFIMAFSCRPQQSQIASPDVVRQPGSKIVLLFVVLGITILVAYLGIWSVYGFRFDAVGGETEQLRIGRLVSKESWLSILAVLNAKYFVIPEAWLYGLLDALGKIDRPSFLLGELLDHGSWLYFPVAFAVKTPVQTLLMILVAIGLLTRRRKLELADLFLLLPPIAFFSLAVYSKFNIGLRHILPIYPFLFVWLGGAAATVWANKGGASRAGVLLLGMWLMVTSVRTFPDYLAFFNEVAGGPANGHKFLVDSNLDWGQDLKGLKHWIEDHEIGRIEFAYFGTVNPSYYGIDAIPAPGSFVFSRWSDDNGLTSHYIAISATYLAGLYLSPSDIYASFRDKLPVATIGHSIVVYRKD